jgi:hypothetical protein
MVTCNQFRRAMVWRLTSIADVLTDVAFSRKNQTWRWLWVEISCACDYLALWVMPDDMKNEKAKCA